MEGVLCEFEPTEAERKAIQAQISEVDKPTLARLRDLVKTGTAVVQAGDIAPFTSTIDVRTQKPQTVAAWRAKGLELIAAGKIAVLLLAGGQGSRLGYDHPKGMYDVGLPSHKSLFQLQAERLERLQRLAVPSMPATTRPSLVHWYILTSDATHDDTVAYFESQHFFGLAKESVHFFQQGMLPALDSEGRVLLESRSKVALSPNGNAGVYQALVHSGALAQMRSLGVEYVHQYGVDNVLVRVADPVFCGFVAATGSDVASKVVRKAHADEPVGVLCLRGGRPAVAEYSEIDKTARHLRGPDGELVYSASHVCINAFSLAFLEKNALTPLPFHVAHKKVPFVGANGAVVTPSAPNAFKAEMFIFDMFAQASSLHALAVPREEEFAPLKNPTGSSSDNPETCRGAITALHASWLRDQGATVEGNGDVEVSPLVSYAGEGLESVRGKHFATPVHLTSA
eukprot:m51a1_g2078 putative udp-n-acetylglucosamine pyrophosphorylase (455) ;mRNA; r:1494002-1495867